MSTRTLCLLLAIGAQACATRVAKPTTPVACKVPAIPEPPEVMAAPCGDFVCLTIEDTVALAKWIARVTEVKASLSGCTLVETV